MLLRPPTGADSGSIADCERPLPAGAEPGVEPGVDPSSEIEPNLTELVELAEVAERLPAGRR